MLSATEVAMTCRIRAAQTDVAAVFAMLRLCRLLDQRVMNDDDVLLPRLTDEYVTGCLADSASSARLAAACFLAGSDQSCCTAPWQMRVPELPAMLPLRIEHVGTMRFSAFCCSCARPVL
jgi:hypothetical protein